MITLDMNEITRAVIDTARNDESIKKTHRLSISQKVQDIYSYANKLNKLFFRKTQL